MIHKILMVALEATLYFLAGVLLCVLHYGYTEGQISEFAGRWAGTCGGWTRALALENVAGNLLIWWAYSAIGIVVLRLHPVVDKIPASTWTIRSVGVFTFSCGATHLLDAYAAFRPSIYPFATRFMLVVASISCVSIFLVSAGLIRVFAIVAKRRDRLEELERKAAKK